MVNKLSDGIMEDEELGVDTPLETLLDLATHHDPYQRCEAAQLLGRSGSTEAFLPLVKLGFDSDPVVRQDAITGLGRSCDSRAYFFLAAYFQRAPKMDREHAIELQRRIVQSFQASRDPRSEALLEVAACQQKLKGLAQYTLGRLRSNTRLFLYTAHVSDERRKEAAQYAGIPLSTARDLDALLPILEEDRQWAQEHFDRPQTYVVDAQRRFVIGGRIQEHVDVAGGRRVLAAGEAFFDRDDLGWYVREMNNRSYGYYPHEGCYVHVHQALRQTGLRFPDRFAEVFPREGWLDTELLDLHWTTISRQIE